MVDEWLAISAEDREQLPPPTVRRNYSGKFVVRVGKELHKELAIQAGSARQSLNAYCVRLLQERLSSPARARSRPISTLKK